MHRQKPEHPPASPFPLRRLFAYVLISGGLLALLPAPPGALLAPSRLHPG